jgi:KaiC/GvpD/RAD55 family RecA-like ATPase
MNLFKTHISGLDEYFRRGLPANIYLVIGAPGSCFDTFVREVAYRIVTSNGVSYFSLNSSFDIIKRDMMGYGFDVSKYEEENLWSFLSDIDFNSMEQEVISELKKNKTIVFDSLSDLMFGENLDLAINIMKNIRKEKRTWTSPHFFLLTEGMQDSKIEIALQHYAEGVIHFSSDWDKESVNRYFTLKKVQGGYRSDRTIPFTLGDNGIKIETSLRIS